MKRFLVPCLLLALPMFVFSQQKSNSSSQQFQKEMEQLRSEMTQQIGALQDSLVKLKEELNTKRGSAYKPLWLVV
jgi:septal ring factor EnvC (AmiA/AmiB activator)